MQNVMFFKETSSMELGLWVTVMPSIAANGARGAWDMLPGVDGAVFRSEKATDASDITVQLYIPPNADIDAVLSWLSGEGDLRFSGWPWSWRAFRADAFELVPCAFNDGWTASPVFKVQPFRYLYPPEGLVTFTKDGTIINRGTADAEPLIRIHGQGDGTLMLGDSTFVISGMTSGVMSIDVEGKVIYQMIDGVEVSVSNIVSIAGDWGKIAPGVNRVSFLGGITKVEIEPRWRSK